MTNDGLIEHAVVPGSEYWTYSFKSSRGVWVTNNYREPNRKSLNEEYLARVYGEIRIEKHYEVKETYEIKR